MRYSLSKDIDYTKVWFTSDLHFGHKNIIKHCTRPFSSVEEMDASIIENWNESIRSTDIVFVLGDVSFYNSKDTCTIFSQLKGRKYLIVGNHDEKLIQSKEFKNLFELTVDYMFLTIGLNKLALFHYPMFSWQGNFHGSIHLHGHTHNMYNEKETSNSFRMDVGVDANNFKPVNLKEILERSDLVLKAN